jgi:hypothetical protein
MRRDGAKTSLQRALTGGALIALLSAFSCEEANYGPLPDEVSDVGGLSLGVKLADGSDVESVKYVVTLADEEVRTGAMPVAPDGTASVSEGNLEPLSGYRVTLTAQRRVKERCRAISSPFAVKAGATTTVPVMFQCDELPAP